MSKGLQILPECYGDTALIEVLEYKKPNHQPNITQVLSTLEKPERSKLTLVGIIDNDKRKPASFQDYVTIKETSNLIQKKHKERAHYLLVLNPALEKFLLNAAKDANVDPAKFGFADESYLKKTCKNIGVRKNQNFRQFVNAIKQKKEDSDVKTLKNWLDEILGEDY